MSQNQSPSKGRLRYSPPMGSKVGYARVSTKDQSVDPQMDALRAAGCTKFFTETASGKDQGRPELAKALDYLRDHHGDVLVVTKLDRLGRSVQHLKEVATQLDARGIGLRSIDQRIDTTTSEGRLFFHILAAMAEFERDLIVERTRDGIAAARARGRKGGRRPALSARSRREARDAYDKMTPVAQIAKDMGVSRTTIYRALNLNPKEME